VLIGLFTELDAPGGVQRAGRHMAAVLTEFAASRGMECRLLSLNDSPELHRMTASGREFVFTGCERGKGKFTAAALKAARRKAKLVLAGHPNLATVARLMKFAAPRMKSIVCTHGIEVWEPMPWMRRSSLQKANLVLAPNRYTANHVQADQGVAAERLRVLPWALDPQFEALIANATKSGLPRIPERPRGLDGGAVADKRAVQRNGYADYSAAEIADTVAGVAIGGGRGRRRQELAGGPCG